MSAKRMISVGIIPLISLLCFATPVEAAQGSDESQWLRDPFRYSPHAASGSSQETSETDSSSDVGLKGIFVSNGRYQALYNGQMVNPGQRIGKIMIHDISPYSIVIEDNAGRRRIELFHEK